ncbi:ATP-binding protein [Hafnia paralvei]|uniref:ATP-binding protein n=1 Tax=Hafnia paralvei TaxID=546367 RepID=A0A2A2MAM9_9GAMM|nr:ATP-binding protein [Hafnia paralvei]KHS50377.1 ATPase [Hafnia paralvei]PAV95697.1 ATP-binding protein [Hafnia paralvei]TBL50078.1 ATP-binding protein [Hafnia paralvei]
MAREHRHPPSAACLSASMRDLGYSLETAIADLIDNSISASADMIDIICNVSCEYPLVIILDNGKGMTEHELLAAMRHGTDNPRQQRSPKDLGRFGLGLKTASFSQCRSLTVVSTKDGVICGAEWNLDRIDTADDWILSILDDADILALPYVNGLGNQGTVVIWQELDRLMEDETGDRGQEIVNEKLEVVGRHLSLVFHRFLSGEIKGHPKISLTINGHPITAFDPFCRKNLATQVLPEEIVHIGDAEVRLQPYVLPHHSRLSASEYDFYQDRSDFISNQGGYVYRNGRLMAWGDWFRLVPKGEATKLARVQIDFPNCLDEAWTIDIKKSRARPPHMVRERLRQIIRQITGRSVTVHRGRGQKLFQEVRAPLWERYADQAGIRYALNGSHPLVEGLRNRLNGEGVQHLDLLLEVASASLPIEMMYSDYSTSPHEVKSNSSMQNVWEKLHELKFALWGSALGNAVVFRDIVRSTRLFDTHNEIVEQYIQKEFS